MVLERQRDPRTGRLLSREDTEKLAFRPQMVHPGPDLPIPAPPAEPEPPFDSYRVWTAGRGMPQEKIYVEGEHGLKPMYDGAYYVRSRKQEASLKKALGSKFWKDDIPDGEPDAVCDTCGWHTRSFRASLYHAQHAHGRPQSGNR